MRWFLQIPLDLWKSVDIHGNRRRALVPTDSMGSIGIKGNQCRSTHVQQVLHCGGGVFVVVLRGGGGGGGW